MTGLKKDPTSIHDAMKLLNNVDPTSKQDAMKALQSEANFQSGMATGGTGSPMMIPGFENSDDLKPMGDKEGKTFRPGMKLDNALTGAANMDQSQAEMMHMRLVEWVERCKLDPKRLTPEDFRAFLRGWKLTDSSITEAINEANKQLDRKNQIREHQVLFKKQIVKLINTVAENFDRFAGGDSSTMGGGLDGYGGPSMLDASGRFDKQTFMECFTKLPVREQNDIAAMIAEYFQQEIE